MNKFGVFIGRFQPFHNSHLAAVRFALERVENLVIVVGSDEQATTIKNPWTSGERITMIQACLTGEELERVKFLPMKDYLYNDMLWLADLQERLSDILAGGTDVVLFGHKKDASSFYLRLFPQWQFVETGTFTDIDATKVRAAYFQHSLFSIRDVVPSAVYDFLTLYREGDEFGRLREEYISILNDKAAWKVAPYQPTFVTTDAIVVCSGHVLVVRRRGKYGRGLIALPGGYIDTDNALVDNCIRELKEETGIKLDAAELKRCIVDKDVFDHPGRDLRGRVITHAFCIKLPDGTLPKVKGMDDADKAWWMSIRDVFASEAKFFADHHHIITRFITRW